MRVNSQNNNITFGCYRCKPWEQKTREMLSKENPALDKYALSGYIATSTKAKKGERCISLALRMFNYTRDNLSKVAAEIHCLQATGVKK
jgi:hypothetical protein